MSITEQTKAVWIQVNEQWIIKWVIYDYENHTIWDVDMILNLKENEYERLTNRSISYKVIFEELNLLYKMEVEKTLKKIKHEAA